MLTASEKSDIIAAVVAKREGYAANVWSGDTQCRVYVMYEGRSCGHVVVRAGKPTDWSAAKVPTFLEHAAMDAVKAAREAVQS